MAISRSLQQQMEGSSLIRRMFEEAEQLKRERGADSVIDLSLGNPILEPPPQFIDALRNAVLHPPSGAHRYMTNAGYQETRAAVARLISDEQGVNLTDSHVLMTCGTAGGMNVVLKALLDPDDEVVIFAPFFVEYPFYVQNHGGQTRIVDTDDGFQPDAARLSAALTPKTKAVIINSPNNPTGVVYSPRTIKAVAEALTAASARFGRPIYLISDEVYSHILYDDAVASAIFQEYPNSVLVTSFSKDLGLPGERIGYIALSPRLESVDQLFSACVVTNRILGFINAPALMQRAITVCLGASVQLDTYRRNRKVLCDALTAAGISFVRPGGAFYIFPRSPDPDDVAYCRRLKDHGLIAVPGSGFGRNGHFRLAYCVDEKTVDKAALVFQKMR
jgi:aspartate aminotransferase